MTAQPGYQNKAECERLDKILDVLHDVNHALRHPKEMAAKEDELRWNEGQELFTATETGIFETKSVDDLITENTRLREEIEQLKVLVEKSQERAEKAEKNFKDLVDGLISVFNVANLF